MRAAQRLTVVALERLCGLLDDVPFVWNDDDRWRLYRHGQLGCATLQLARRAAVLDGRWQTNVWGSQRAARRRV